MNKVAHYLQEHLIGEVIIGDDARNYFSTDSSIFQVMPSIIAYPRNENDVRKTLRFTWQLAERGRFMPVTARGAGSDQSGASVGKGIIMVFPAHMNRILELDTKSGYVTVEPGLNYAKLQQTLHTHGKFLPPYPASIEYSTIGGAIANNAGGHKSVKYGSTIDYTKSLRVVLANGEVIEAKRITKRELNKKLGLATFEGEIYRSLDTLIEENQDTIKKMKLNVENNSAGYNVFEVKGKDGSFDLTPLFVGSQGTLGIVSEIVLKTDDYNPTSTLTAIFCNEVNIMQELIDYLKKFPHKPSAIEMVDDNLLNYVNNSNPNQLGNMIKQPFPKFVLFVEFDDISTKHQTKMTKKLTKHLDKQSIEYVTESDEIGVEKIWKLRQSVGSVIAHGNGRMKAVPLIDDAIVPVANVCEFIHQVYGLFESRRLPITIWGHIGSGNIHVQPLFDLSQLGDRQKAFKVLDDYYSLVSTFEGSSSAHYNDGRLRAPYLDKVYDADANELLKKIKSIFDPYNTLNTGVKIGVSLDDVKPYIRQDFSLQHLYSHMPRT